MLNLDQTPHPYVSPGKYTFDLKGSATVPIKGVDDKWQYSFCIRYCAKSGQIRSFFWSLFSCIWTEYGDLRSKSPYLVQIQENTDQKKLRIWTLFTQWGSFLPIQSIQLIIILKPSVVYPNTISLIALMFCSLQIIGLILKSVPAYSRKLSSPILKWRKRNQVTQRSNTRNGYL